MGRQRRRLPRPGRPADRPGARARDRAEVAGPVAQAYRNVVTALAGAGAGVDDLLSTTVYVVDWQPDKMGALMEGLMTAMGELDSDPGPLPPATLIGVAALADPGLLVEIQVLAVTG